MWQTMKYDMSGLSPVLFPLFFSVSGCQSQARERCGSESGKDWKTQAFPHTSVSSIVYLAFSNATHPSQLNSIGEKYRGEKMYWLGVVPIGLLSPSPIDATSSAKLYLCTFSSFPIDFVLGTLGNGKAAFDTGDNFDLSNISIQLVSAAWRNSKSSTTPKTFF